MGGKTEGKVRVLILLASCLLDLCKLAGSVYWGPQFQSSCPYSSLHGFWEPLLTSSGLEMVATLYCYYKSYGLALSLVSFLHFYNSPFKNLPQLPSVSVSSTSCWTPTHTLLGGISFKKNMWCVDCILMNSLHAALKSKRTWFSSQPYVVDLALWPQAVKIYFNFCCFFFWSSDICHTLARIWEYKNKEYMILPSCSS